VIAFNLDFGEAGQADVVGTDGRVRDAYRRNSKPLTDSRPPTSNQNVMTDRLFDTPLHQAPA
jgi:hypothetical protein